MPSVVLLNEALRLLQRCGYVIRQEWLDGAGGGPCRLKGRKLFFLDLALPPEEQLEVVVEALREEDEVWHLPISPGLAKLLQSSRVL